MVCSPFLLRYGVIHIIILTFKSDPSGTPDKRLPSQQTVPLTLPSLYSYHYVNEDSPMTIPQSEPLALVSEALF